MRPTTLLTTVLMLLPLVRLTAEEPAEQARPAAKKHPANHLAKETSPYLLQHAHNPVAWYPWGEEALAKAKRENKLIFLSIGYSSCHWCHVMERETFHDEEIARYLNEHFVCIKVDREERPDIDTIYMTALRVYLELAGSRQGGGWPLSMFLTPEAQPVFGGTYFPARDGDRPGLPGFLKIIKTVQGVWDKSPDRLREDAATITKFTKAELERRAGALLVPLDEALVDSVEEALHAQFDPKHGGFGYSPETRRPKFPEPSNLVFLLARIERDQSERARTMLEKTLAHMAQGGLRDHVGGGFHRYTVDSQWQIPHFEKMLYDNAQLAGVYAKAHALTGRDDFRRVAIEVCDFVLREMTSEGGAFYAAIDAESEAEEGKFYRWEKAEVERALTTEEWQLFAQVYGLDGDPNFEEQYYVPQLARPLSESAAEMQLSEAALEARLAPIRAKLFAVRAKRPRPKTDIKILTADNGLMIAGLADAGRILKEPKYVAAAGRAAEFVLQHLRTEDGRLLRSFAGGEAKLNGYLDDYAFLAHGLLRLHEATGDARWLEEADAITAKQIELLADEKAGGFFFTTSDHETLLVRHKELADNALPAGNSVAAGNLLALARARKKPEYLRLAEKTIATTAAAMQSTPSLAPWMATHIPDLTTEAGPR
jgi:uncharacterized protein